MHFIVVNIKWLMLISGLLTSSMFIAVIAPDAMLLNIFGTTLREPLAEVIVRSWGALVTLMGGLLICGALYPMYRNLALSIVVTSKVMFISITITFGSQYLPTSYPALLFDAVFVTVFVLYLTQQTRRNV